MYVHISVQNEIKTLFTWHRRQRIYINIYAMACSVQLCISLYQLMYDYAVSNIAPFLFLFNIHCELLRDAIFELHTFPCCTWCFNGISSIHLHKMRFNAILQHSINSLEIFMQTKFIHHSFYLKWANECFKQPV